MGLALLLLSAACGRAGSKAAPPSIGMTVEISSAEALIRNWPEAPRATARAMIAKYGEPNSGTTRALRWIANGPWEKTIAHRSAWPHILGTRTGDSLEQTVACRFPDEKTEDLRRFDVRLELSGSVGRMSARSESESMNFLILNLAHEIAVGARSVKSAREFIRRTEALSKAGKSSAYTEGLLYQGISRAK